ncbi:MAG: hypothetical protein MJA31_20290 [Clostridia bacterium]|nr:hypothetical protein [Clostridia bacterium]
MRNKGKVLIISFIGLVMFSIIATASSNSLGTEQDPVVTVSYVEAKINELKTYIDEKLANTTLPSDTQSTTDEPQVVTAFEVLNLQENQSLIGKDSTEIILRSGTANAIDNGVDGISDLTGGKDLKSGDEIERNHLLIVPRDDGRGILATSEIWVMVKGGYEIK